MATTEDETDKREIMPYRILADKIDNVTSGLQKLEVAFAKLEVSVTPRHEIAQEVEKRVPMSVYVTDREATIERIAKLEAAPQGLWNKTGILISAGIGCLSLLVATAGVVTAIISIVLARHP